MYKYIKTLFLTLLFPCVSYADENNTPLSVAIVTSEHSEMQISTTKYTLRGDNVLICLVREKSCTAYQGDNFSSANANHSVEDVATGKNIYTYSLNNSKAHNLQAGISLAFIFYGDSIKVGDVRFDDEYGVVIRNDKIKHVISYCTGSEGVHVLSKPGDIHLYYFLGYEVEANCSDEVYK